MKQLKQKFNYSPNYILRDDGYLANIALLYYQEGLNQSEIAKRLGLSRTTILNYLKEGRERGIVDIRVNGETLNSSKIARDLAQKYKLEGVYVAYVGRKAKSDFSLRHTARVAALALHDIIAPGDLLGIAWGETIKLIGEQLPNRTIPNTEVCQVIGSMESDRLLSAEDCAIQIANKIGAQCHTLHAPAILSSPGLANGLRDEPAIKKQLKRLKNLNAILTSVGDLTETTHVLSSGLIKRKHLDEIITNGGVGFLCGNFIKSNGDDLPSPLKDCMISITPGEIRKTPKRIMVASGEQKLHAVKAALIGGHATHVILDENLILELLKS